MSKEPTTQSATRKKTGGRKPNTPNRPKQAARNGAAPPNIFPLAGAPAREASQFPAYKLAKVDTLIPYANNARTHSPESIDALCRQITANGWTAPMLVAGKRILAGHRRHLAAVKLGLDVVPVIDLSHLSAAEQRAYILWDNQSVISGSAWDNEMLAMELGALRDDGFDLSLSGFDAVELGALFGELDAPKPESKHRAERTIRCPACGAYRAG